METSHVPSSHYRRLQQPSTAVLSLLFPNNFSFFQNTLPPRNLPPSLRPKFAISISIASNTISDTMSSAKRRGQARGQAPDVGGSAPRRGPNPARGRVAPFDGPASRGSGSAAGTQSQVTGSAAGSRRGSNAGTQAPSQAGSVAGSQSQAAAQVAPIARDPAREGPVPRTTDSLRNVDMPASFYNIDNLVSQGSFFISPYTIPTRQAQCMDRLLSHSLWCLSCAGSASLTTYVAPPAPHV